jgi:hypothetical protein
MGSIMWGRRCIGGASPVGRCIEMHLSTSFDSAQRACRILSRKEVTLMAKKGKAAKASKKKKAKKCATKCAK